MTGHGALVFKVVFNAKPPRVPAHGPTTVVPPAKVDPPSTTASVPPTCAPARKLDGEIAAPTPQIGRLTRMLALAYVIEREIAAGTARNYEEVGKRLGITGARVSQITNLLTLSPRIQERIIDGAFDSNEQELRGVLRSMRWADHELAFKRTRASSRRRR